MPNFSLSNPVHASILGVIAVLILASVIVFILRRNDDNNTHKELADRVKSWWFMIAIFSTAILTSPMVSVIFFALISFLAFKEFISIIPLRRADRRVLFSHAAMLMKFPATEQSISGGLGLIMFMAILNQGNDVAQYIWGKLFGKHKIVPQVSPKKTWEGFIGGAITTMIGAALLAPFLTPFSFIFSLIAGLLIACAGFIGDVTFSALKRDLKIKDSGSLIPGHGGILDRIDSLSLTAPLFFHLVRFFYY